MKKLSLLLAFALLLSAASNTAWAASPWTEGKNYQEKMFRKLDFGLKNLVIGPTYLISDPLHGISKEGAMGGLRGLGDGVMHAVTYTVGGLLHTVTFPITNLDIPIQDNGVQCPFCKKA